MVRESESFQLPAKGMSSKSRTLERITQTELSNRYEYLEDTAQIDDDSRGESGRKSPLVGSGRIWLRGEKPQLTTRAPSSGSKLSLVSPDYSEMTRSKEEGIPCCSSDTKDSKREKGTVTHLNLKSGGVIYTDNISGFLVHFDKTHLHSEKELGLKTMDSVTFICQLASGDACHPYLFEAKDVRLIDNG